MSNSEKNFHSNKIQDIKKQMRLDDDEDENASENGNKDKYDNINIDCSELLSKNGNKINLSGKDLTTEKSKILLNHLTEKYPNITELDINNCNLEHFPKILLNFKKLISFDLRNNNFLDFESLSEDLSNYNNLTDLKIDLTDQNQVLMILSQIPKLIFLNGKSTKEAVTIVDLEEKDIEDISLQKEVEIFNEIINKLNDKEEKLKNNNNNNEVDSSVSLFSNDFQNKLYEEAEKIKNNLNNNLPNYIYANNVIQSQFELKKMLSDKFLSFLNEEDKSIGSLIFNSIFKTGERLVELVNTLFPKIEEKTDSLRNQLEEAWKIADEITDFEGKYKKVKREKDFISSNFEIMEIKMKKLEDENKAITEKLLQMPKELEKKNIDNNITTINNTSNTNINEGMNKFQNRNKNFHNNISNLTNKDLDKESSKNLLSKNINNSNYSLTNNSIFNKTNETRNDGSYINTKPKFLSLKMAKEIMNEIYNSKIIFDRKCYETGKPRETMEQHMYTYLNQKYGLKNLIIEWASSIINAIKLYSNEDCEINLFGKILRNEQDEDSRIILYKLQENISELLEYYLKEKNPLKSQNEIKKMLLEKKNGILTEEEWKGIIYYLYSEEDANNLENKIIRFIQKQKEKFNKNNESMHINTVSELHQTTNPINNSSVNGTSLADFGKTNSSMYLQTHGSKKMTRRDIFNMFKFNEDDNILYTHFINLVGDHQIKSRDKYLKNFVTLFRKYDTDLDGVLNENEFINMIKEIPYCQDNVDDYVFRFLSTVDPFNNKKITFNECISLFSMEIIKDNNDNNNNIGQENNNENNNKDNSEINQMSLLDKICLN
jgi:hypothetical protein